MSATSHPPTSRYYAVDTATWTDGDGREHVYLRRRFSPLPERLALLEEHTVAQGDRLDNLTAHYLGDPEQFFRLCDANAALLPDQLTATVGATLRITLPEGSPGPRSE